MRFNVKGVEAANSKADCIRVLTEATVVLPLASMPKALLTKPSATSVEVETTDSPSELEEGSELDVLFKGEMLRYEVHQYFVINVRCVVLVDDL